MSESKMIAELRTLQEEMFNLSRHLQEFSESVSTVKNYPPDSVNMDTEIVDGEVIKIGKLKDYRLPKMYQLEHVFGDMNYVTVGRHLFSRDEIHVIENIMGRNMDKFDTIYVQRPKNGNSQSLKVIRLVRYGDVMPQKL